MVQFHWQLVFSLDCCFWGFDKLNTPKRRHLWVTWSDRDRAFKLHVLLENFKMINIICFLKSSDASLDRENIEFFDF